MTEPRNQPETPESPKTLTARNPTDLLALVPYFLGFHPQDSVVVMTVGPARTPVHARQDLPDDPGVVPLLVEDLVTVAVRSGVSSAAVIAYTLDEALAGAVVGPLVSALEEAGVRVPLSMRADGDRWYCLGEGADGSRPRCPGDCPADGAPYDLSRHPITLEAVVDGRLVHATREALRDSLVGGDPDEVARVTAAAEDAGERLVEACRTAPGQTIPAAARPHLVQEGRWVQHRIGRFVRDGRRLDSHDVGRLVVAVASIEVRDVAWAQIGHADARRHVDLWSDVVRRCPRDALAAPAALLSFAAWLAGDGALAWCAVDLCQGAEPGYSMAGLVTQALAGGIPPAAWSGIGPDALTLFAG
jgi:hypothetical protein